MKPLSIILVLLPLVLPTGCVRETLGNKRAQLCAHLTAMDDAIAALNRLGSGSTISELKQAEAEISAAFRSVKASATEVPEVDIENLETAYEDLDKTVEEIADESSIAQAVALLSGKVSTVEATVAQLKSGARCPE